MRQMSKARIKIKCTPALPCRAEPAVYGIRQKANQREKHLRTTNPSISMKHTFLALGILLLLFGCTQTDTAKFELGEQFTISEEKAFFGDNRLAISNVTITDSRCSPDVQCVWAGELGVKFTAAIVAGSNSNENAQVILGETTAKSKEAIGYRFELVSVDAEQKTAVIIVTRIGSGDALSVKEVVENKAQYLGKTIEVEGRLTEQACTKMACVPEQACCNSCSGTLYDYENMDFSILAGGKDCALGGNTITGTLKEVDGKLFLDAPDTEDGKNNEGVGWFSIAPIQCGNNKWNNWADGPKKEYISENALIVDWLQKVHGVEVFRIESIYLEADVCSACDCPRGDRINVLVGSADFDAMASLGWKKADGPVACTMEAKLCPDGSYVGRVSPTCEFEQCPTEDGLFILKTDNPGFTIDPVTVTTKIYENGNAVIKREQYDSDTGNLNVTIEEKTLTSAQIADLRAFVQATNFFSITEEDARSCIIDLPTQTLEIIIGEEHNTVYEIGAQCEPENVEAAVQIISEVEVLIE